MRPPRSPPPSRSFAEHWHPEAQTGANTALASTKASEAAGAVGTPEDVCLKTVTQTAFTLLGSPSEVAQVCGSAAPRERTAMLRAVTDDGPGAESRAECCID